MSSGTTWKEMPADQPRVCAGCGEKIKISGERSLMFSTRMKRSWHADCFERHWRETAEK